MDKTAELREQLFRDILHGRRQPGERLPTEREMADERGLSRVTVRRAYALLEAAGIVERRQGAGTFVSSQVRGNPEKNDQVALLASIEDTFVLQFVESLEQALARRGALLILRLTHEDPAREEQMAIDLVARGITNLVIWPSGGAYARETFARLRVLGTNMVFFDRLHPGPIADFIGLDNRHAIEALLGHAHARGAKEFLFLSHSELNADSDREREECFAATCARQKWRGRIERVPWRGNVGWQLEKHLDGWAPNGKGTAILCVNDDLALEVARARGSGEMIYGIDGMPEAIRNGIVTYRQPMSRMANQAVKYLFEQQAQAQRWQARCTQMRGELIDAAGE